MIAYIKKISNTKYFLKAAFFSYGPKAFKICCKRGISDAFFCPAIYYRNLYEVFETVYQREPVLCNVKSHLLLITYQTDYFEMGQET